MEIDTKYKNIIIARGDTYSYYNIDILVDNQSYGILRSRDRLEINIEENKAHRVQCVICNGTDIIKSNVLFFNVGELTNIYVQIDKQDSSYYKQIELSKCEDLDKLDALMTKATKENEIKKQKNRKKNALFIAGIIIIPIIIVIICFSIPDKVGYDIIGYERNSEGSYGTVKIKIFNNTNEEVDFIYWLEIRENEGDDLVFYQMVAGELAAHSSREYEIPVTPHFSWQTLIGTYASVTDFQEI